MGWLTRLGEGLVSAARATGNLARELMHEVREFVGDAYDAIINWTEPDYPRPDFTDLQMEQQSCEIVKEALGKEPFDQLAVLSPDERKMAVTDIIEEVSGAMEVELEEIIFEELDDGMSGYYSEKGNRLVFDESCLCQETMTEEEAAEVIDTVFHELRHAYQLRAARRPFRYKRDKMTAAIWRLNRKHYVSFRQNPKLYFEQPLEVDARNFAASVISSLRRTS